MAVTSTAAGRAFGFLGLCFQIGMLFAYGFGSNFLNEVAVAQNQAAAAGVLNTLTPFDIGAQFLVEYIFMAVFALIGFGLLLSFLKYGTWSGMTTALMVIAVNVQLGFLMQKFWFNVFTNSFGNNTDNASNIAASTIGQVNNIYPFAQANFQAHNQFSQVNPNVTTLRICLMATISCLVAFTGFIGRIGLFATFFTTIIFNIGWNLCYYVNVHLNFTRSPHPLVFDDFGTNNIYIFGSFFGLIMTVMLNCKKSPILGSAYVMNRVSSLLCLTGTAFLFATFALTGGVFPNSRGNLSDNLEGLNIVFALSSSVIGTYFLSALLRGGKVGIREAMLGTISGGVIVGSVSGIMVNMAIAISVGFFAGMLSAFWYSVIHPRLNRANVFDSHGMLGAFWLVSIFGGVVFAPSLVNNYKNNQLAGNIFGSSQFAITGDHAASLQLAYAGVAAGTGIVLGLIAAIVALIMRNNLEDFNDASLFLKADYGLYAPADHTQVVVQDSAQNLRAIN